MGRRYILTADLYEKAVMVYKKEGSISSVKRALNITHARAKKLINNGEKEFISIKDALILIEQKEKQEAKTKENKKLNKEKMLQTHVALYNGMIHNALLFYHPTEVGGSKMSVNDLKGLRELGLDLERAQRDNTDVLLLPYEDMTDEEFTLFAIGEKKPKR